MIDGGLVVALLALIVTIDLAQFAVTLEHRGRLAHVEAALDQDVVADGGEQQ